MTSVLSRPVLRPHRLVVILAALLPALTAAGPAGAAEVLERSSTITAQADRPSCRSISYPGTSGRIDVQTSDTDQGPVVSWAITMYDEGESVGRWDVDTYLNGKKTSSGFHRNTSTPYVPHGSILARAGQRFNVEATLLSASGRSYHNVTNECFVP